MHTSTNDLRNNVVNDGVQFLKSLVHCYGTDRAMGVWEKMGEALGQDIKGRVFLSILTNSMPQVRVSRGGCNEGIRAIKVLRTHTDMTLKAAKDVWDDSGSTTVVVEVAPASQQQLIADLRAIGMVAD